MRWTRSSRAWPLLALACVALVSSCRAKVEQAANSISDTGKLTGQSPFNTREPDHYQAVRTITVTLPSAQSSENKTLILKNGVYRREESTTSSGHKLIYLECPAGVFILLPDQKILSEIDGTAQAQLAEPELLEQEGSPQRLLHEEAPEVSYQRLGEETLNGRISLKYRLVVNSSSSATVSTSETIVWIDRDFDMPVKTETRSANGTLYSMELSELKTEVDQKLFDIPKDYKRVAGEVIRSLIAGEK